MRILLSLLILVVMASDVFGLNLSLGPGLSAKNAMLDVTAMALVIRFVLQGNFKLEIPAIVGSYAVMFVYAALSIVVAALVIQYPHYDLRNSVLTLKINIVDPALLLLTFFYGTRSFEDAKVMTRILLGAFTIASVITITNVYGYTDIGNMEYGDNDLYEANRVYGFFGHANETGALIAVFLPAYVAVAMSEKGAVRFAWLIAMMISVVVLIMTGSRGALAGLLIGVAWAAYLCRKYLSPAKLLRGGLMLMAVGIPIVAAVGAKYGGQFIQRMMSQGSAADVGEVSSGRTDLWAAAIGRMMETPISLITGFGWDVYESMGFALVPHNHYILLWFELGLVGLGCYMLVIRTLVRLALSGLRTGAPELRGYLIALVFGVMILSIAILFEQLYKPWYYIWCYVGITLRFAMLARQRQVTADLAATAPGDMVKPLRTARS
jgi:O-antigen ligase